MHIHSAFNPASFSASLFSVFHLHQSTIVKGVILDIGYPSPVKDQVLRNQTNQAMSGGCMARTSPIARYLSKNGDTIHQNHQASVV
jgi:hypothetical protein